MTLYDLALIGYKQLERRAAHASANARMAQSKGWVAMAKRYQHFAAILYHDLEQARRLLNDLHYVYKPALDATPRH